MLPARFPRPVRLALYALAALILLGLCLAPTKDLPDPGTGDRFEHLAAWFVLTLTGYVLAPRRRLAIPAFAFAYGVVIEVLQAVTPFGRHGDPKDLAADVVGIALACAAALVLRRFTPPLIDAA
ncbi:MAG TPA: VanZ family protein [Phenylobacterium sp.]|nr:VanZ family protein [Phenylobacterium sp.]